MDLAKKGMNIVLVSRSKIKLDEVSSQISKKYKVDTKIIVIDFIKEKKTIKLIQNAIQVILFCPNLNTLIFIFIFIQYNVEDYTSMLI